MGGVQIPKTRPEQLFYLFVTADHWLCAISLPLPLQTSAKWQPLSPGSLQNSTTSLHVVSGVMGTSVTACSPSLRYTVNIIYVRNTKDRSVKRCWWWHWGGIQYKNESKQKGRSWPTNVLHEICIIQDTRKDVIVQQYGLRMKLSPLWC